MATRQQQQPPEQSLTPEAAAVIAAAQAGGLAPPVPPAPPAAAALAAFTGAFAALHLRARRQNEQMLLDMLPVMYPDRPEMEYELIAAEEGWYADAFRDKQRARVERDVAEAVGLPAPERAKRLRAIRDREKHYFAQHEEAQLMRALGRQEIHVVRERSPLGGRWKLGRGVKQHTPACIALAQMGPLPWEVLEAIGPPPIHTGCQCKIDELSPGDVVPDALEATEAIRALADEMRDVEPELRERLTEASFDERAAALASGVREFTSALGRALRRLPGGRWQWRNRRGKWIDMPGTPPAVAARRPIEGARRSLADVRAAHPARTRTRVRRAAEHGLAPLTAGEPFSDTGLRAEGYVQVDSAPETSDRGRWRHRYDNPNGQSIIVRTDSHRKVLSSEWWTPPEVEPVDEMPRSWEEMSRHTLAWAQDTARRFGTRTNISSVELDEDLDDTAGFTRPSGDVDVGPDATRSLAELELLATPDEGQRMAVAMNALRVLRATTHEALHTINPIWTDVRRKDDNRALALEEALNEELSYEFAVEELRGWGATEMLAVIEANPDQNDVRGTYRPQRRALQGLIQGVPPEQRRELLEGMKFRMDTQQRREKLAELSGRTEATVLQEFPPAHMWEEQNPSASAFAPILGAQSPAQPTVPTDLTFRERGDQIGPEWHGSIIAEDADGKTVGVLAYSLSNLSDGGPYADPQGTATVMNVEVLPSRRREGIATAMLRQLEADPSVDEVRHSATTDDGTAWREAIGADRPPLGERPDRPLLRRYLDEPSPAFKRRDSDDPLSVAAQRKSAATPHEQTFDEFAADPATWWHGTPHETMGVSGMMPKGEATPPEVHGIHLGDWHTASEAVGARAAGQHVPEGTPKPAGVLMIPVRIEGPMSPTLAHDFVGERRPGEVSAEMRMQGILKRGQTPRQGYFYKNEGEGVWTTPGGVYEATGLPRKDLHYPVSAVVPNASWIKTHEQYVREALARGDFVPPEVLAEYGFSWNERADARKRARDIGVGASRPPTVRVRPGEQDSTLSLAKGVAIEPGDRQGSLYHVTTNRAGVESDGFLTVGKGGGMGAFGGEQHVSFTTSRDVAEDIANGMRTNIRMAQAIEPAPPSWHQIEQEKYGGSNSLIDRRYPGTVEEYAAEREAAEQARAEWGLRFHAILSAEAERQGWTMPRFEEEAKFDSVKTLSGEQGLNRRGSRLEDLARISTWKDWMGQFWASRPEELGGNPIFIGLDQTDQAARLPDQISIVETDFATAHATGGLVTHLGEGGLEEVRVYADVPVNASTTASEASPPVGAARPGEDRPSIPEFIASDEGKAAFTYHRNNMAMLYGEEAAGGLHGTEEFNEAVLAHGRAYERTPLPAGVERGQPKDCFRNALMATVASGYDYGYVEGYVWLDDLSVPIQHAWVEDVGGRAIEVTIPDEERAESAQYFGVRLDPHEAARIALEREMSGPYLGTPEGNAAIETDALGAQRPGAGAAPTAAALQGLPERTIGYGAARPGTVPSLEFLEASTEEAGLPEDFGIVQLTAHLPGQDEPVATLLYAPRANGEAYIHAIRVDPGHRRQGIATALLRRLDSKSDVNSITYGAMSPEGEELRDALEPGAARPAVDVVGDVREFAQRMDVETYEVGGVVRDELLGRSPKDVDLLALAPPERIRDAAHRAGAQTDDLTVRDQLVGVRAFGGELPAGGVEIAPPRIEHSTGTGRHDFDIVPDPNPTEPGALTRDARRRDFTINALYRDRDGKVIDPTGHGQADLEAKLLRTTHSDSFRDDPLRILRGARFAAQLDFGVEPETAKQMREHADAVTALTQRGVSGTVRDELDKLLLSAHPERGLQVLRDAGVLQHLLPEMDQEAQPITRGGSAARLSVLFKDADAADAMMARLNYPNAVRRDVRKVFEGRDGIADVAPDPVAARVLRSRLTNEQLSEMFASLEPRRVEWEDAAAEQQGAPRSLADLAIDGDDLIELGWERGPELGAKLRELFEDVLERPEQNDKSRLLARAKPPFLDLDAPEGAARPGRRRRGEPKPPVTDGQLVENEEGNLELGDEWSLRASRGAPRTKDSPLYHRPMLLTYRHRPTGARMRVRLDPLVEQDKPGDVAGWEARVTYWHPGGAHLKRKAIHGRVPSERELEPDLLAWSEELAERVGQKERPVTTYEFAALGRNRIGSHEPSHAVVLAQRVSEGVKLARGLQDGADVWPIYAAYKTIAHETNHGLNPVTHEEYQGPGRALEETLNEETAHELTVELLRRHGLMGVLERVKADPTAREIKGVYQRFRHRFVQLLDDRNYPPEKRAELIHRLKYDVSPARRIPELATELSGEAPPAPHVIEQIDAALTLKTVREGNVTESGFEPILRADLSFVPDREYKLPSGSTVKLGDTVYVERIDEERLGGTHRLVSLWREEPISGIRDGLLRVGDIWTEDARVRTERGPERVRLHVGDRVRVGGGEGTVARFRELPAGSARPGLDRTAGEVGLDAVVVDDEGKELFTVADFAPRDVLLDTGAARPGAQVVQRTRFKVYIDGSTDSDKTGLSLDRAAKLVADARRNGQTAEARVLDDPDRPQGTVRLLTDEETTTLADAAAAKLGAARPGDGDWIGDASTEALEALLVNPDADPSLIAAARQELAERRASHNGGA